MRTMSCKASPFTTPKDGNAESIAERFDMQQRRADRDGGEHAGRCFDVAQGDCHAGKSSVLSYKFVVMVF